jgi:tRNA pseudouridine32 synthase / 23S rRNA pseudouridine746 synthase
MAGIEIVHATERFVVIDKPPGLLSVPGKGEENQDCAAARVRAMFPGATGPMVVHRLDMDTSGLLIVALDAEAQRELSMQFERREVEKSYVALVEGAVAIESGTVDVPIRMDPTNRPYQVVDRSHHRPAVTCFKVLSYETDRTRLELIPQTGRTHQLRVHCAHMGYPILGDVLYGPQPRTGDSAPRLMLHAARLGFTDPGTGRRVRVERGAGF